MKVYVTTSYDYSYCDDDFYNSYYSFVFGKVVESIDSSGHEVIAKSSLRPHARDNANAIHSLLEQADVMVAFITGPSINVGLEIGTFVSRHKTPRTIVIYDKRKHCETFPEYMLIGDQRITLIAYRDLDGIEPLLRGFLDDIVSDLS